ncbi:MAG TPA: hypothetical protein VN924_32325 [Bryobacteraceae bacterium]|nr:hypothetical protein [Bryobacteraceae bacterium]
MPILFNGIMFTVLAVTSTSRMAALEARMAALESAMTTRFDLIMGRLMDAPHAPGRTQPPVMTDFE